MLFFLDTFLTTSINSDVQKDSSSYTDFIDEKSTFTYDVETKYQLPQMQAIRTDTDRFIITEEYVYHKSIQNLRTDKVYREQLVLRRTHILSYYERISHVSRNSSVEAYIPFFRKYDESILTDILKFWDNPAFGLETQITDQSKNITVNINDLNANEREYVESYIQQYVASFVLPSEGDIYIFALLDDGEIEYIQITYSALLGDEFSLVQKINISESFLIDTASLINGAIDLFGIEQHLGDSSHPLMEIDEAINSKYDYFSPNAELYFIEITTEGEYKFTSTTDSLLKLSWYLYDLEGNQYNPYRDIAFPYYFDTDSIYVYLNPGIYYVYLSARPINTHSATLSYSLNSQVDDHYNGECPDLQVISGNGKYTFETNYEYDLDAFVVTGDFDYIVIEYSKLFGIAFGNINFAEIEYVMEYVVVQMPFEEDLVLYFSSTNQREHEFTITFYNTTTEKVDFSEVPLIDNCTLMNTKVALPFQGEVDRFAFSIVESSNVFVSSIKAKYRILDSNFEIVDKNSLMYYDLAEGKYYIELYDFTDIYATFSITPERSGEQIHFLPMDQNKYHIQGFVSTYEDIDIYQFTLETDMAISFYTKNGNKFLLYGVDNPYMNVINIDTLFPYFLPAGTYNLTMPAERFYVYNFELIKIEELNETEFVEFNSVEVVNDLTSYTYEMSFNYLEDTEKMTMHIDQAASFNIEFPEGLRVSAAFTNDSDGIVHYFEYTYNEPGTNIVVSEPGVLVITFQTLAFNMSRDLLLGDYIIKVNLTLLD